MMIPLFAWIGAAAAGGFIGGRVDWLSCTAMKGLRDSLIRPENHDLAKGLVRALIRAMGTFLHDLEKANPFDGLNNVIAECEHMINHVDEEDPPHSLQRLVAILQDNLSGFLALVDSDERMSQRGDVEDQIVKSVAAWLTGQLGAELPSHFLQVINLGIHTDKGAAEPLASHIRLHLGEEIKDENGRFRHILQMELAAATNVSIQENIILTKDVLTLLSSLTTVSDAPRWETFLLKNAMPMTVEVDQGGQFGLGVLDDPNRIKVAVEQGYVFSAAVSSSATSVVLLQEHAGIWYPMQLRSSPQQTSDFLSRRRHERILQLEDDVTRFPRKGWFRERNSAHTGLHRFALLTLKNRLSKQIENLFLVRSAFSFSDLQSIGEYLDELDPESLVAFYVEVLFVSKVDRA